MDHNPALEEEVAKLAYQIYEQEGRPEGCAAEHWARAQRAIREQRISLPAEPKPPKKSAP